MANSQIATTEGTGKNIATYSFSETTTKELQRNTLNKSDGTELGISSAPIRTDPTGTTAQPVTDASGSITVDAPVATPVFVRLSDGSSAITTLPVSATPAPATTGGLTTYHLVSANSTNATVVKNSAGQLYGWYIYNSNAAARKLVFHNASSTPTAGASVFFSLMIPGSSGANVSFEMGIPFSTGISITTVTELADSGTTAVGTSDLIINLFYK